MRLHPKEERAGHRLLIMDDHECICPLSAQLLPLPYDSSNILLDHRTCPSAKRAFPFIVLLPTFYSFCNFRDLCTSFWLMLGFAKRLKVTKVRKGKKSGHKEQQVKK